MPELYIVYCIDTEGPLHEPLAETFNRIEHIFGLKIEPTIENLLKIQNRTLKLNGPEDELAIVCDPHLLDYNDTWGKIDTMLNKVMAADFRLKFKDQNGKGIVYNWHCVDHVGYETNERRRDIGYGNIFNYYEKKIRETGSKDKIHWHFHPISFNREAHISATSYDLSYPMLHQIITRRVIDNNWFPTVNRAGFHTIRQDSNLFLEQWVPFDFSNQSEYQPGDMQQKDLSDGRFGDWRRAPLEWKPYNPDFSDYQSIGNMNRFTTKCLNIGTRLRLLTEFEITKAFELANTEGKAILSFTNHDFRDMSKDIEETYTSIFRVAKQFKNVNIYNCDAVEAMQAYLYNRDDIRNNKLKLNYKWLNLENSKKLYVEAANGNVFGSQPYLSIKTNEGSYYHDNLDEVKRDKIWSYTFDRLTLNISNIQKIKIAANDRYGNCSIVECKKLKES